VAACQRSAYGFVKSPAVTPTLALNTQTHTLRGDINTKHRHTHTRYVTTLALNTQTHTLGGDINIKHRDTQTHVMWGH